MLGTALTWWARLPDLPDAGRGSRRVDDCPTIRISRPRKPPYFPYLAGAGSDLGEVMCGANLNLPTSAGITGDVGYV